MPGYLKKGWGESRWQRIVKFRLGDGIKEGKYWEEEEGRKCRICGWTMQTWEHLWEECVVKEVGSTWKEKVGEILGEEGEGEGWLREIERIRNREKGEEKTDRNE